MVNIGNSWDDILKDEFQKEYYKQLRVFLKSEYQNHVVFPNMYDIFNAFKLTPYEKVKIVILGQDPYHEKGQAQGLCFSVPDSIKMPPSLVNIYKEIYDELGIKKTSSDLSSWAKQGVLLLNAVLTVREGLAGSHSKKGWEIFTDDVIRILNQREDPIIFILWGAYARQKKALITNPKHYVLESAHPSPLSAYNGFFGNGHFKKANEILKELNKEPINW